MSSAELQFKSLVFFVENAIFIYQMAIDKSVGYLWVYFGAVVRCPAAFVMHVLIADGLAAVEVNNRQIGMVALANEAPAVDLVEQGGVMAHQIHDLR